MTENEEKCCQCGDNPAEEPHTCPYREEIDDDYDNLCNCCPNCEYICERDI